MHWLKLRADCTTDPEQDAWTADIRNRNSEATSKLDLKPNYIYIHSCQNPDMQNLFGFMHFAESLHRVPLTNTSSVVAQ